MDSQNFIFPYEWDEKPVVNELLVALIKRDFEEAKKYVDQLNEFTCTAIGSGLRGECENPKFATFERCLYEFLCDYDVVKFLVDNGFKANKFLEIACINSSRRMGIIGRAYSANQDKRIVELLLSAGFTVFKHGGPIGSNYMPMWKYVMIYNFDREIIDLMLSYGQSADDLLDEIKFYDDDPNYKPWAADYLRSRPTVTRRGVSNENKNVSYSYSEDKYKQYDTNMQKGTDTRQNPKEGCYIATAVYGGYDEPQVLVLRKYRDKVLRKTFIGRLFVRVYYVLSPGLAKRLKSCTWLNEKVKNGLDCFVDRIAKNIVENK